MPRPLRAAPLPRSSQPAPPGTPSGPGSVVGAALLGFLATLAVAGPAPAQGARVSGEVVDAQTRTPLAGINVRVASTTLGASTDADGRFSLSVPAPGVVRLVASSVGYEAAVVQTALAVGDSVRVEVALTPAIRALRDVDVSAGGADDWRRALASAEVVLLGGSPNGRAAVLVNPEVLALSYEGGVLEATGEAPLVVRNERTGYVLTLYGLSLVADRSDRRWGATVSFDALCDGGACPAAVREARRAACEGSLRHFLQALADGRSGAEGFEALLVGRPGGGAGPPAFIRRLFGLYDPRPPTVQTTPYGWEVEVDRALAVTYRGEDDERPGGSGPQESWLTVDGGTLRFGADGSLSEPDRVVRWGYWDWERVGDLVPPSACTG